MVSLCFGVGGKLGSGRERVRQTDRQIGRSMPARNGAGSLSWMEALL